MPKEVYEGHHSRDAESAEEELLVSAKVPALEEYHSPARLVALTRCAVLVIEDVDSKQRIRALQEQQAEQIQRYELASISSVQLHYSLMGSGLSLFVPQPTGRVQRQAIPFHSPAVAWFLPLYTRLRLLLNGPYRMS